MSVACYLDPTKAKAHGWMRAFARGCNGEVIPDGIRAPRATDHVIMGNWPVATKLIAEFAKNSADFWYMDSSYIRTSPDLRVERNRFWPVIQQGQHSIDRALAKGVQIRPWRYDGSYVLVCQHGYKFGRPWSIDIAAWHESIIARIRAVTDRPIVVRPKPWSPESVRAAVPLERQLAEAWCVVTHSSTVGVVAALAGVPVFCEPTCAAAPVACTDFSQIETPVRPEREGWIAELAWRQWSRQEMSDGIAWDHLRSELKQGR